MKLAIVGVGRVAKSQMRAIELAGGIGLVAACDIDPGKAALLPSTTKFHPSLDSLIENSDADLILVSTPTNTHHEVAERILERGKNLLLEKPACENRTEFASLLALQRPTQFFAVALHYAYAAEVLWWLRNAYSAGLIPGRLSRFEAEFYDPYVSDNCLGEQTRSLGGSWLDSGINALSVIGSLLGAGAFKVRNVFRQWLQNREVETKAELTFQDEVQSVDGTITTSWLRGTDQKTTRLYCEYGSEVLFDHSRQKIDISQRNTVVRTMELSSVQPALVAHYANLFRALRNFPIECDANLGFAIGLHNTLYAVQSATI